jgi:hypothetical protein
VKYIVEIEKRVRTYVQVDAETAEEARELATNDPYHAGSYRGGTGSQAAAALDKLLDDLRDAEITMHEVGDWSPLAVDEEGHGRVWERPQLGRIPVQDRLKMDQAIRDMMAKVRRAGEQMADALAQLQREAEDTANGEPPLWSKIESVENPNRWARREPSGWVRYTNTTIQSCRLTWESVQRQLGEWRIRTDLHAVED